MRTPSITNESDDSFEKEQSLKQRSNSQGVFMNDDLSTINDAIVDSSRSDENGRNVKDIHGIFNGNDDGLGAIKAILNMSEQDIKINKSDGKEEKKNNVEDDEDMKKIFRDIFTTHLSTDVASTNINHTPVMSHGINSDLLEKDSRIPIITDNEAEKMKEMDMLMPLSVIPERKIKNNKNYELISELGTRILREKIEILSSEVNYERKCFVDISDDFLRIPQTHAVRLKNPVTEEMEWKTIEFLQNQVTMNLFPKKVSPKNPMVTKVIVRNGKVGLGMTIHEKNGKVQIHALVCQDGTRVHYSTSEKDLNRALTSGNAGPAQLAGIRPGDHILGVNGKVLISPPLKSNGYGQKQQPSSVEILKTAVHMIMDTPDPVVLHIRRLESDDSVDNSKNTTTEITVPDLLDIDEKDLVRKKEKKKVEKDNNVRRGSLTTTTVPSKDSKAVLIHPISRAMTKRSLLRTKNQEIIVTYQINQFNERAEQWETTGYLRFDPTTKAIKPIYDKSELPYADSPYKKPTISTPSTPCPSFSRLDSLQYYPGARRQRQSGALSQDVFLALGHVRKALCTRIMHSFLDGDRTAYTIWVYDVESGKEWYSPVRFYKDFQDLRSATCRIYPFLSSIPFPSSSHWGGFWSSSSKEDSQSHISSPTLKLLEVYLRSLCAILYTGTLQPRSAEVAIHLQSFLGCDVCFSTEKNGEPFEDVFLQNQVILPKQTSFRLSVPNKEINRENIKIALKRSVQRYIYRIFLLPVLDQLVTKFIDDYKCSAAAVASSNPVNTTSTPTNPSQQSPGIMEEFQKSVQTCLDTVKDFLDQMHDLLWDGCQEDLIMLSKRFEFDIIQDELDDAKGACNRESWIREAIREQVEIEIYVPLRSSISRLLVQGWKNDDLEMQLKVQELKKRSQSYFKIPSHLQSPSNWASASKLLTDGVGRSTLPCEKLRAIITSAHEIARLSAEEQLKLHGSNGKALSADDFLPIFIFCFVQAELSRPCALCVLLRTLCDPLKQIGETGYYLASFEASVSHIDDLDLDMEESSTGSQQEDNPILSF